MGWSASPSHSTTVSTAASWFLQKIGGGWVLMVCLTSSGSSVHAA